MFKRQRMQRINLLAISSFEQRQENLSSSVKTIALIPTVRKTEDVTLNAIELQ